LSGHAWSDEKLSAAFLSENPAKPVLEPDLCFHGDLFWHLVRGELSDELRTRILDHTAACPACLLALRLARATSAEAEDAAHAAPRRAPLATLGSFLRVSFLHPAAAGAYLVLLLASFPLSRAWTERPSTEPAASAAAPAATPTIVPPVTPSVPALRSLRLISMTGDLSLRGGEAPAPMRIPWKAGEALALRLFPDLEELPDDPATPLAVRVLAGKEVLSAAERRVADIQPDESLPLLLDTSLLRPGRTYRVELRVGSASRPALRQSFQLEPE
jgi:hypothetical protein